MFRRLAPLGIALFCLIGLAPAALAGGSGTQPAATTNGNSITITSTGNLAGETVNFTLTSTANTAGAASTAATFTGSSTADGDGVASFTFTNVPADTYTAVSVGQTSGNTQTFSNITVAGDTGGNVGTSGSGGSTTGGLADTGSDTSLPIARTGIVLLAAGAVAVYAGQRRRTAMKIGA